MHGNSRQILVVMVIALTVAVAGCTGGGDATPTDAEADGDGGDGGGSDGSSDDATPTAGAEVEETATATQTPTLTPTPNASGPTTTDDSEDPLLEDLIRFPDSYRYRVETNTGDGTYVQVGRWYEGDYYGRVESTEQQVEVYRVDGQLVTVSNGQCMEMDSQQIQNPENATDEDSRNWNVRPVGTDTVDGESVYVYEVDTGQRIGTVTYYVDTESGYPRKMEFMQTTYEYSDFGSVDPIESPC